MATTQLRLRGVTVPQVASAMVAAAPLLWLGYQAVAQHAMVSTALAAVAGVVAILPWLSRAVARATYRAKFDDIAVHVRGEALPYKTITAATVTRTPRRHVLTLRRGETVSLELVLWDAFAGRLEPRAALAKKLAEHGHAIEI